MDEKVNPGIWRCPVCFGPGYGGVPFVSVPRCLQLRNFGSRLQQLSSNLCKELRPPGYPGVPSWGPPGDSPRDPLGDYQNTPEGPPKTPLGGPLGTPHGTTKTLPYQTQP